MDWLHSPIKGPDPEFIKRAREHQNQLTKPAGALGQLETLAIRLAGLQSTVRPVLTNPQVVVFAGDHGIAGQAVSAFPQSVTAAMVQNFAAGGAAVSVMARNLGAELEIVDTGIVNFPEHPQVIRARAGNGTADFSQQAAMTPDQLQVALDAGKAAAQRAKSRRADIFIGAEMGIANTSSASALACALLIKPADQLTGCGTGINDRQRQHKTQVVQSALDLHQTQLDSPLRILQYFGGFEIAALVGAYLQAAHSGIPILIDGFICSCAALCAIKINPDLKPWLFFAHCSQEQGHQVVLDALQAEPILHLGMRLGEGSGALAALPLLTLACSLHNEMATFAEADVATGI